MARAGCVGGAVVEGGVRQLVTRKITSRPPHRRAKLRTRSPARAGDRSEVWADNLQRPRERWDADGELGRSRTASGAPPDGGAGGGDGNVLVTENQLDEWVRGNAIDAQGVIVELVWRLVAASSPRPKERRFPLGDSIGQHGPDGLLNVDLAFEPFVPEGRSLWEIGTGLDAGDKATIVYGDLISAIPETVRSESTFVFVTPLSARRDWKSTWKENAQQDWLEKRRAKGEWRDVRVVDGTKLIDWIHQFYPVELWLAQRIGLPAQEIDTPEQRWSLIRSIGEPPPLTPAVFLANRDEASGKIKQIFNGTAVQLKLDTHFPDQVVDFVSACLADLDDEDRADAAGRCLVISGAGAWNTIAAQRETLILIADPALDLSGEAGTKLIQKARRSGHAVIFGGAAGGLPDPTSVALRAPRSHQLSEALQKAGYGEERARTLAQKSGGNLGTLLRCLQNLSLMPEWAEGSVAAELAIAAILGSWNERSDADRAVVESLTGKAYGEWIEKMRETTLQPSTPLVQRDGNWRFVTRYEGWHALGPRLFDEHLDRIRAVATTVFRELDPQLELPVEERYLAHAYEKVFKHSYRLRKGLAESLALLGSHPSALSSCTSGRPETTADLTVRAIFADADWQRWASLNDVLPLLAEAAPGEFLDSVERASNSEESPFDGVLAQESNGVMGRTYMTGVLWALETLAWSEAHLGRAVICLGELAARDPGGTWANRPANSLTTILLPWLPQTCASVAKRGAAVSTLLAELPEVGWKLLMSLLPRSHSTSSGTRRPEWREIIPEDWSRAVRQSEYWEQIQLYSEMAIAAAKNDSEKLAELIRHIASLPASASAQLLAHLGSEAVTAAPEAEKVALWTTLTDLVGKHRKFSEAEWAMEPEQVEELAGLAERLSPNEPALRYQRLFSGRDFELYEEKGSYEDQSNELEVRRQNAIREIAANGGTESVLAFAAAVTIPWRVGIAFGVVANPESTDIILPGLLESDQKQLAQFTGGFVLSKFHLLGWKWVDELDTSPWTASQIGEFLSYLPFTAEAWERSRLLLGDDEAAYWSRTKANPVEAGANLELAIDQLMDHGRPTAALRCLSWMLHHRQPLDRERAIRALLSAVNSSEDSHSLDAYQAVELIKALQADRETDPGDLSRVEWAYLPLLDRHSAASPTLLWRRLATEPEFFCELIRLVFRSRNEGSTTEESTDETKRVATNAYRLLSEWQIPPGWRDDGTMDDDALYCWLASVKKICSETGHLEIALTMIGRTLVHVPPDPDGLWIARSAAAVLNAKDAGDMRDGFQTELFNSRGAHWVDPTGKPEKELAAKFHGRAESVEEAGYHRLAATLRQLARGYEREAEGIVSRERFDD